MRTEPPGGGVRIESDAAQWLARRDGAAWSSEDDALLQAWLDADIRHRVAFLRLEAGWREAGRLEALGAGCPGGGPPPRGTWQVELGRNRRAAPPAAEPVDLAAVVFASRPHQPRRGRGLIAAAAVAACALALGMGWWSQPDTGVSHHRTGVGQVATIVLADGSEASLASDSRIEVQMSRRGRRVALLQGEAFFDVARHRERPFIVAAGGQRVEALGTAFAVRRRGPDLRVVVTEGTVRLGTGAGGETAPSATLPAGSIAHVGEDGVLVRSLPLDQVAQLTGWRSGLLVFRDAPLSEAVEEFNRFNVRKILIMDPGIADLKVGGSFRWDNTEAFVRLLEQGFPVRAEYTEEQILLQGL